MYNLNMEMISLFLVYYWWVVVIVALSLVFGIALAKKKNIIFSKSTIALILLLAILLAAGSFFIRYNEPEQEAGLITKLIGWPVAMCYTISAVGSDVVDGECENLEIPFSLNIIFYASALSFLWVIKHRSTES